MYHQFDYTVDRKEDRTIIRITKCRYVTALFLLGKFRDKFGRWTDGTEIKLYGEGNLTNLGCNIEVCVPHPKDPKHTLNPFTKEYVSGYFNGLQQYLNDIGHDYKAVMEVVTKDVGIT